MEESVNENRLDRYSYTHGSKLYSYDKTLDIS